MFNIFIFIDNTNTDSKVPPDIRQTCHTSGTMASLPGHSVSYERKDNEGHAFQRVFRIEARLDVFGRAYRRVNQLTNAKCRQPEKPRSFGTQCRAALSKLAATAPLLQSVRPAQTILTS